MKRLLTACIALSTLFAAHAPGTAGPPPRDISAEIAALRPTIVSARLYHIPDSFSYRHTLREEDVTQGCYYAADKHDDLDPLLDLLAAGGLTQQHTFPHAFVEVRTVIHLTTQDGKTIPLALDMTNSAIPMQGTYDHTVLVGANMAFGPALYDWKRHHTPTSPTPEIYCIED